MSVTNLVLLGQRNDGGGILPILLMLIQLAVLAVVLASNWVLFTKAGKPGWASLIPIYNLIVMLEIVGRPVWWIVFYLIPCVNFVMAFILAIDLAKSFGKDAMWGIGLIFLGFVFLPLLAFGDARYRGPVAAKG